ncbi:threonine-phosphate decarboxylase CobD [Denitratisoma oestradiolicum]|uniref:threonine-phosphate decarboxylase n=1 Tax=Denitratisoma oestradiolicum TaxID=311182 RepID=A0A6S6XU53_9PROT|nr:threonine-phosphate decarboxylase CobD [Denitratisoma oestradiolicum]TWO79015.1 threonine-phosphate decarboxylase [Denitratisoma oestradiolicum]CAB1368325.1 Threonine-phosphate decarboxylase [Denitratisoma oestradiolicum]
MAQYQSQHASSSSSSLAPLHHGGRLRQASIQWDIPIHQWVDLSTGIAPFSYPFSPPPSNCWERLPEEDDELQTVAQKYYELREDQSLLPVAGSQAAIQALPRLRTPCLVAVQVPSYAEHLRAWHRESHQVRTFSPESLDDVATNADVVVVINPNNPTGHRHSSDKLLAVAHKLNRRGGWLVIDEAFADVDPTGSLISNVGANCPSLIVLRSLGKFFGLAGARVGFVIGPASLLTILGDQLGPWSIAHPCRHVAVQALTDQPWQFNQRRRLVQASQRLAAILASFGLKGNTTSSLFHYIPRNDAARLHHALARQGILTRLFDSPPALRIGLPGDEEQWQRLSFALDHIDHHP